MFEIINGEVDKAISVMREVALWCEATGKNMWKQEDLTREKLLQFYKEEEFYIGIVDGIPASCMVIQWQDTLFWPKAPLNEAGYLHKLCVKREYAGMRLSKQMVDFAANLCRSKGVKALRLDTGWKNTRLWQLYESYGFEKVDKYYLGDKAFALYEMKL